MVFSSITFIFYFLPIFLFVYFISTDKFKNFTLLMFSILFYIWGEPKYVLIMILSCIVDYIHAIIIENNRGNFKSKIALCSSICINLGLLCYFKYTNFFIDLINNSISTSIPYLDVTLPIGLSFYTFQTMSYSIDVYKGEVKAQRNFLSLATYITLFPQLVAGPIVRYKTIENDLIKREHSLEKTYKGLMRFFIGLSKKVLIANNIGLIWDLIKNSNYNEISMLSAWIGIISFGLQIYYDFSGYSDMAIGLGTILGFDFLENFNYPYISESITEFWRRWHISLGQWFKDYVYIPLGGNRGSKHNWLRNVAFVWILTGLWHGAGTNFILWGVFFGSILIIEKLFLLNKLNTVSKWVRHLYVLLLICISWVIFEIDSLTSILSYLESMFFNKSLIDQTSIYLLIPNITLIIFACVCATPLLSKYLKNDIFNTIVSVGGAIISVAFLIDASFNPFLYFRF